MPRELHNQWPAKLLIIIIITQMIMLGYLSNLKINFNFLANRTTINILNPCPKAETQSKISRQICQSQLCISLNSFLSLISFLILKRNYSVLTDHSKRYKILAYDIFKPPKN